MLLLSPSIPLLKVVSFTYPNFVISFAIASSTMIVDERLKFKCTSVAYVIGLNVNWLPISSFQNHFFVM